MSGCDRKGMDQCPFLWLHTKEKYRSLFFSLHFHYTHSPFSLVGTDLARAYHSVSSLNIGFPHFFLLVHPLRAKTSIAREAETFSKKKQKKKKVLYRQEKWNLPPMYITRVMVVLIHLSDYFLLYLFSFSVGSLKKKNRYYISGSDN